MGKVLVIGNANFSNVAVKKVDFLKGTYIKITPTLEGADSLVSGEGFYAIGETATLSAASNDMYSFVKWSDEVTTPTRTITVTSEGNLNLYAEYEINFVTNSFVWGNGGIMTTAGKSSGSINHVASTVTKFIHTISECIFAIDTNYKEDFDIYSVAMATEKPTYNRVWSGFQGYEYLNQLAVKQYTIPAGRWLQISIGNTKAVSFTSDLSNCANILLYAGTLELVS